jgi:hypothetical protein
MHVSTGVDEPAICCLLQDIYDIQMGLLPVRAALYQAAHILRSTDLAVLAGQTCAVRGAAGGGMGGMDM